VKPGAKTIFLAVIAAGVGLVVLLGYFIPHPALASLRALFLDWAIVLAAMALLVGVVNIFRVHLGKVRKGEKGRGYSLVILIVLPLTLLVVGFMGPASAPALWIYNWVLFPIEASLLALLAVVLVYAGARLFAQRLHPFAVIFLGTAVLVIIGMAGLPALNMLGLGEIRSWITNVWALGGARGILLGVALGVVATGLRILMGADRPYGD
jgi:hypothetical protein